MATPSSQKADKRPISFVLTNEADGSIVQVTPPIRPEDLSRQEPSLQTTVNTFGGAYVEDFGKGVATIQISGHTGWRGAASEDGVASFLKLRNTIWTGWHDQRQAAVEAGRHPDDVKLVFVDGLDEITSVVTPASFSLKRSKSRPLLMMYQISMTVLTDRLDAELSDKLRLSGDPALGGGIASGVASIKSSVNTLRNAAANVRSWVDNTLVGPVRGFLEKSTAVFNKVVGYAAEARGFISGTASQLIGVASDLAQVGRNAFNTFNAVAGIPTFIKHQLSSVAAAYSNVFCVMKNVFKIRPQYADYTGLYGASNCSSTSGGSPLSAYEGQNPFDTIIPTTILPTAISPAGRANMDVMKAADPVLAPMAIPELAVRLGDITNGVTLS